MGTDLESEFLLNVLKPNQRVYFRNRMEMKGKKLRTTLGRPNTTPKQNRCLSAGERRCEDGSCIARVELCRKLLSVL